VAAVKGFIGAYYKGEEGVTKGVVYREDKEGERRREELIASPVRVKLRRLRRDTMIISLSSTRVSASLSFVQTCCSSF
jgi:predicted metalloprotease